MPREISLTVYKFDELSDDAKQKAIQNLYDINIDYEWWESTYEDAALIGCTIDGFDLDRGSSIDFTCSDAGETAEKIMKEHGPDCETFKLAAQYVKDYDALERDEEGDLTSAGEDAKEELDRDFTRALSEEYLSILRREYEYQTSEEAIIETIEANDYDFTEDGKLYG
jgi:hypothetical protein